MTGNIFLLCRKNRNYRTISRSKKVAQASRRKKARKRRIRFYRIMAIIKIILFFIGAQLAVDTICGWVHKPEKEKTVVLFDEISAFLETENPA